MRSEERIAKNNVIFREANERIYGSAERYDLTELEIPFICECAREDCLEIVRLSLEEYQRIRANPRHFLNAPGHERADAGSVEVVAREERYFVVEKVGEAGRLVEQGRDGSSPSE